MSSTPTTPPSPGSAKRPPAVMKVEDETEKSDSAKRNPPVVVAPSSSTDNETELTQPTSSGKKKRALGDTSKPPSREPSKLFSQQVSRRASPRKSTTLAGVLSKFRNKNQDVEKAQAPDVAERARRRRDVDYDHHVPLRRYVGPEEDFQTPSGHHSQRVSHEGRSHDLHDSPSMALVHGDQGRRLSAWSVTYAVETRTSVPRATIRESEESLYEEGEGFLDSLHYGVRRFITKHSKILKILLASLLVLLFAVYLGFALYLRPKEVQKEPLYYYNFCRGVGFLLIITALVIWFLAYYHVICPVYTRWVNKYTRNTVHEIYECFNDKTVKKILYGMTSLIFVIFLIFDGVDNSSKLRCSAGVVIYVFLGYIFSKHPSQVQWTIVFWGLVLQYTFALLILYWGLGDTVIGCISNKVKDFVEVSNEGANLIFGYLVNGTNQTVNISYTFTNDVNINFYQPHTVQIQGIVFIPWVVGFRMVPAVLFFSCVLSILFYYGLLQWFVVKIAWLLQITMGTTAAESINSAANIFLGCTEAPLIIRPFLAHMTKSELHAILTAGFATIAGTMFAVYVAFGLDPKHLMSATFMSAPAALAYAKLLYPETEESITTVKDIKLHKGANKESNVFAAAANGTINAIPLVATIISTLITFISLLKLVNLIVTWFGSLVGFPELTLELIMGKIFIPCAYFMGIDGIEHCTSVGELIGLKTIISEFVAYEQLKTYLKEGKITKRESVISVYALCGFSNLSAIGMQLGTLGALAPQRMDDMADVVLRALVAGSATCFLTACIAGSLLREMDENGD